MLRFLWSTLRLYHCISLYIIYSAVTLNQSFYCFLSTLIREGGKEEKREKKKKEMATAPGHAMDSAGAKSVMSNNMKELHEGKEEISNVIRGHKANLSNPSECLHNFIFLFVRICRCFFLLKKGKSSIADSNACNLPRHKRSLQGKQRASPQGPRRERHPGGDKEQAY